MIAKLFTKSHSLLHFFYFWLTNPYSHHEILEMLEVINIFHYYIRIIYLVIYLFSYYIIIILFFLFRSKGKLVFIFLLGLFKFYWCYTYLKENS